MKINRFPLALVAVTSIVLAGCDQCSKKEEATKAADSAAVSPADSTATTPTASQPPEPAPAPASTTPSAPESASAPDTGTGKTIVDPTGGTTLKMTDVKVGKGPTAVEGKKVSVFYTGTLLNGTKFDSTKDRGTPFSFVLGSGMVIAGWDQGVKGMKEGGIRKLVIPSNLAYGNRAVGGVIPPNSTLVFEIELLKVE